MRVEARITARLSSEEAEALEKALKPEAEARLRGVEARVSRRDDLLIIEVRAPNTSAARATTNSLLRLASAALRTIDETRKLGSA
jgi:tRNA threonylcarbamoyladenosine modification (KEOPS) complex  Pcc1 subunit